MSAITMPPASASPRTPPQPASGPKSHRWMIREYREPARTGLFHDVKTMLLHGELFAMTMSRPRTIARSTRPTSSCARSVRPVASSATNRASISGLITTRDRTWQSCPAPSATTTRRRQRLPFRLSKSHTRHWPLTPPQRPNCTRPWVYRNGVIDLEHASSSSSATRNHCRRDLAPLPTKRTSLSAPRGAFRHFLRRRRLSL